MVRLICASVGIVFLNVGCITTSALTAANDLLALWALVQTLLPPVA
jgi:hypothetical protein